MYFSNSLPPLATLPSATHSSLSLPPLKPGVFGTPPPGFPPSTPFLFSSSISTCSATAPASSACPRELAMRSLRLMILGSLASLPLSLSILCHLVRRVLPQNFPFFDGLFDFGFTMLLREALFPLRLVGEMERTEWKGGICVVVMEKCEMPEVEELVAFFRSSTFVAAHNVTLYGQKMTTILLTVTVSASSS